MIKYICVELYRFINFLHFDHRYYRYEMSYFNMEAFQIGNIGKI